jgi:predicted  nucleic acid-binding Zn-ribbon protein
MTNTYTGELRVRAELEKLIELQNTDTNIRRLKKAINSIPERRAEVDEEYERHAFEIRELENAKAAAHAKHGELDKQIAEAKHNLEKADRDLKSSQNQKQYEASMRAADTLNKEIAELQGKVDENNTLVEEADRALAERAEEAATLESDRAKALKKFEDVVKGQQAELDLETKKRAELFATLPKNYAGVYDRLSTRSRDGVAVAEVKNNACSSCFMALRPQVALDIKTSDNVINCESCGRILYILDKQADSAAGS